MTSYSLHGKASSVCNKTKHITLYVKYNLLSVADQIHKKNITIFLENTYDRLNYICMF